jgi:hypothetical protein
MVAHTEPKRIAPRSDQEVVHEFRDRFLIPASRGHDGCPVFSFKGHTVNHTATPVHKGFQLRADTEGVIRAGKHYPIRFQDFLFDGLEFVLLGAPPFPVTGITG